MRSSLPNSMDRDVERQQLTRKRQENQPKLALKKGRTSKDQFSIGDKVRIRNHLGGRWDKRGVIVEERSTGTASPLLSLLYNLLMDRVGCVTRATSNMMFQLTVQILQTILQGQCQQKPAQLTLKQVLALQAPNLSAFLQLLALPPG